MRKCQLTKWMTEQELELWQQQAPTLIDYVRRLAIRMVSLGYSYGDISRLLLVSETTILRWVQSFNSTGAQGLTPGKRGGRRRSLLTLEQEKHIINQWLLLPDRNAKDLQKIVQQVSGQKASLKYVYDLIHRHETKPAN